MGNQTTLSPTTIAKMLNLFNHRLVTVERDGYPEQAFEMHYDVEMDAERVSILAFNNTSEISIDVPSHQVQFFNSVYSNTIKSTFISSYDALLYTYHLICVLSNADKNNAMFVLTALPTVFTILLKIYEELPESSDADVISACKEILGHTQDICFDHNSIVISRKKL